MIKEEKRVIKLRIKGQNAILTNSSCSNKCSQKQINL